MSRFSALRRAAKCAFVASLVLLGVNPALAQDTTEIERLDRQAVAEFNSGLDARDAGRNGAACQHFRNAEGLYHNSIIGLMRLPMRTAEQREAITSFADQQQSSLNEAKARAKEICGRPDTAALTSSSSRSAAAFDDDRFAEKKELQRLGNLAHSQYKESVRLWEAGDKAGACAAIRLSTTAFDKVSMAIKADPALARGAFANPDQVLANGQMATEVRDEDFCKG
jgi:hypothetical protein